MAINYWELGIRWFFASQMIFWGLNGIFKWIAIPPSGPLIERFSEICAETKFIMPTVKFMEIFLGLTLILNLFTPVSLILFAPLMFVISGLHIFHNPRAFGVLLPLTVPYLILCFFHLHTFLRLLH